MTITKKSDISSMVEKLRAYFHAEQIAEEVALLVAWSTWHKREIGSLDGFPVEQLRQSYTAAGECFNSDLFSSSQLFQRLPLPLISELMDCAKVLADKAPTEAVRDLISFAQEVSPKGCGIFIPDLVADLLADSIGRDRKNVALYHESSLSVLAKFTHPETAFLKVFRVTPLVMAVTYLLGSGYLCINQDEIFTTSTDLSDVVVSTPVIGFKVRLTDAAIQHRIGKELIRSDEGALERAVSEVQERGVLLLPLSVLFSRSTLDVRKTLVDNNWLHALVHIPEVTLLHTAIPSVCLVIDKTRRSGEPVQFVDVPKAEFNRFVEYCRIEDILSHEHHMDATPVTVEGIKKQGYDLSFSRYKANYLLETMAEKKASSITLDGVSEIIRAQAIKGEEVENEGPGVYREVTWRSISEAGFVTEPDKCLQLDEKTARRAEKQRLQSGDILLAVKGGLGNIAIVPDSCGTNWIAGQAFVIIRPRQPIVSSAFLYRYLSSDLIQAYLDAMATGTAVKIIKAADLNQLPVELPSPEQQQRVVANYQAMQEEYRAIQQHREKINQLRQEFWSLPQSS